MAKQKNTAPEAEEEVKNAEQPALGAHREPPDHPPVRIALLDKQCEPVAMHNGFYGIKVREITNMDGELFRNGVKLNPNQQIIIKTGLQITPAPSYRIRLSALPELMVRHEIIPWPYPFPIEGEMCIGIYCFGRPQIIKRADIIAIMRIEKVEHFLAEFSLAEKKSA